MFQRIFDPDNKFFRLTGKLVDIILLSLLWLLCSLPLITFGAATAGLYHACHRCLRGDEPGSIRCFLRSFRQNLGPSIPVAVLLLVVGAACYAAYLYLYLVATAGGAGYVIFVAYHGLLLVLLGMSCYLFPALSRFTMGPGALLVNCAKLSLSRLPSTLALGAIAAAGAFLCLELWMPVVCVPAAVAMLHAIFLEKAFLPFLPTPEEET